MGRGRSTCGGSGRAGHPTGSGRAGGHRRSSGGVRVDKRAWKWGGCGGRAGWAGQDRGHRAVRQPGQRGWGWGQGRVRGRAAAGQRRRQVSVGTLRRGCSHRPTPRPREPPTSGPHAGIPAPQGLGRPGIVGTQRHGDTGPAVVVLQGSTHTCAHPLCPHRPSSGPGGTLRERSAWSKDSGASFPGCRAQLALLWPDLPLGQQEGVSRVWAWGPACPLIPSTLQSSYCTWTRTNLGFSTRAGTQNPPGMF